MKKVILTLLAVAGINAFAASPPSQLTVDQYVFAALYLREEQIVATKGKVTCGYVAVHPQSLTGKGRDVNEATVRLQLMCLRERCESLKKDVQKEMDELLSLSEEEFRDHLEFIGKTAEEIEAAVMAKNINILNKSPNMDCKSSSSFRTVAFDSCFATPISCQK